MSDTDLQLLERYTRQHSEDAFAEIVRRHLDLVHSAALRQVRSPQLAEEVSQSVFTDLAGNAQRLAPDTILTAWLYQVTRRTAIDVVRRESRRQLRERVATAMNALNTTPDDWTHIEHLLDDAMEALDETDRAAVLLRYFENKSLREVGQTLGTSDDAAQKRVSRAVERLRDYLAKHGVAVGSGSLVVVISSNAVQAAPVGLGTAISSGAVLAGAAIDQVGTIGLTKALVMTTIQKAAIAATVAAAFGVGIFQARRASQWRNQFHALQQQIAPIERQIQQLRLDHDGATSKLQALRQENERLHRDLTDLPRVRGEVARLLASSAAGTNDPIVESTIRAWTDRVAALKQKLEQMPDRKIPELQYLTEKDWARAAKDADIDTEDGVRDALGDLRTIAKTSFIHMMQSALHEYMDGNDGLLPGDLSQLKPYFATPVEDTILQRYELLQSGRPSDDPSKSVAREIAPPADSLHDSRIEITMNGIMTDNVSVRTDEVIAEAAKEFAKVNNGRLPTQAAQITPYLPTPIDEARVKMYLDQFSSHPRTQTTGVVGHRP